MQIQSDQNNPTTSVRHYSLFVMAIEAVAKAREAKHAAYLAAEKTPSHANFKAFMEADKALTQAEKNLNDVRLMNKYLHRKMR